jgi:hypothetical protein
VRFKRLTMPSLLPGVVALLNAYGPALSQSALMEVVLHRLQPSDLALPNSLGMQPGSITVTDTGLVIGFVPKPLSQNESHTPLTNATSDEGAQSTLYF